MRVRWKDFELPTRVVPDSSSLSETYGRFIIEPFERGFGTTIGNSLRRVLLSSIEGAAVTSVKIENTPHEFTTIPGVVEDVTDIMLNVKRLIVTLEGEGIRKLRIEVHEKGEVKAGHILATAGVKVLNPDLHIATLSDDVDFLMEMEVRRGRGYVTAEENEKEEHEIGVVYLDSGFSPVQRVRYSVENTRVGKLTNYDKLILEVWTNGTVHPERALVESSKILRRHLNPLVQYYELGREMQLNERREEELRKRERYLEELRQKLSMNITELDLSVRAVNCLSAEGIQTIAHLVSRTEQELLAVKNFGKTSLKEVKRKL
ncbi:MAG: DNA-directed RNA polymerase subunit alpha, partial [Planctomycetota bacterium]|nr:DNA-directed RNA polymerase subunit alpha [Planctomycetota bacterium]